VLGTIPEMKDSKNTFVVSFEVPPQSTLGGLRQWCELLDAPLREALHDRPLTGSPQEAVLWVNQVLTLAWGFLHVLRVPLFDPIEVLRCEPSEKRTDGWDATCRTPDVSLVPLSLLVGVLKVAFRLAPSLNKASIDDEPNRDRFFAAIDKEVIRAFSKFKPNGKSTFEVLRAAHHLGVPYLALPGNVVQLGWGARSRRIDRSTTDHDSAMGMRWTQNKLLSARLLRLAGLPAPTHFKVDKLDQAKEVADRMGYPVVVKPADLERGEGVSVDVREETLESAFNVAHKRSPRKLVLVEQQVPGVCHRLFIAAGKLLYAVKRLPIGLYADGRSTIRALVEAECKAQHLMPPWKRSGLRPLDDLALHILRRQAWGPESIPESGRFVALRRIETTEWGGVDEDVTKEIHPDNVLAAVRASQIFGLEVAGVDMISPDIRQPWHSNRAVINEINYAPLLGGGAISRTYLERYLHLILKDRGRIPVQVYPDNDMGRVAARTCWLDWRIQGLQAYLLDVAAVWDEQEQRVPLSGNDPIDRLKSLLMWSSVEALVVIASSAEPTCEAEMHRILNVEK